MDLPGHGRCFVSGIALVGAASAGADGFSLVTYNTHGNSVADWSTNSPQVRAIGRQMQFLQPDVVTFQEIPLTNTWQMANFVAAFLPGYFLATNSGTDGFIRSAIASRFPIRRSAKWLDGVSLAPFGGSGNFTRDLFEAEVAVPGFSQPVHVFTTHLKSASDSASTARRAAEARAISNFFASGFLTTNGLRPYVLTGDMNEDFARPVSGSGQPIQTLTSLPTGLQLLTPTNPATGSELTFSIQAASMTRRYDYVLPAGLLAANVATSFVFRTDLAAGNISPALAGDSGTASDHLPVFVRFGNPYSRPFRMTSATASNGSVGVAWQTVFGGRYRLEGSTNLSFWTSLATNLVATNGSIAFVTNTGSANGYFRVGLEP